MPERLTDRLVKAIEPPASGNLIVYDDLIPGFGARVTAKGARSFVLTYRFDDAGEIGRRTNEYRATIGRFPAWSTPAAREEAKKWRRLVDRGETHPLAERRGRRKALRDAREAETYAEAVRDYIEREQRGRRKNATADEVERILLREGAAWKERPVASIAASDVRKLVEMIRDGGRDEKEREIAPRPYLANKAHALLHGFFAWCAEPGIDKIESSPMTGLKRPWDGEEARQRVFSDDEIKAIWRAAEGVGGVAGAYVKVLVLTGKRKLALAQMRWADLDEDGTWTPPADARRRKKNKRLHGIPLPALAMRIIHPLRPADGEGEFVFAGSRRGTHLTPGSKLQERIQEGSGISDFFFHATRHTLETRLAGLGIAPHLRDLLLDHAPARGAGALYDHHAYQAEMRDALETWAAHVEHLVTPEGARALR